MDRRPITKDFSSARPAGASDSEDGSDDGFDSFGFGKEKKYVAVPSTDDNTGTEKPNGPLVFEDWENDTEQPSTSNESRRPEEYWGETPSQVIRFACMRGNLDKLKEQLDGATKYDVNEFFQDDEETLNPLITACLYGNHEIVEYLLTEKSANPNSKHYTPKMTPIIAVASCVHKDDDSLLKCAKELVKAGADLNKQERCGMSALMLAVKRKERELVEYLLESGADPNLTEPDGHTALFYAAMDGDGRMCRRLIENGADVNVEDRFGWSVPELAQDRNFTELANLLFKVRETKWKPGLHPELMMEFDEEAAAERKLRGDSLSVTEDSSIQMMLQAVDGEKYLKNFRKHKIRYVQLLTLDEEQLKEIGVDEVGVRESLLDNIKRCNNAQWQSSSIKNIATNKNVTAAEAVCMVVNIREHMEHVSSALEYVNKRIKEKPLALQYDTERNRLEDLMKFCEQTEIRIRQARNNLLELHKTIGDLRGYNELQIVGRIPKRSFHNQRNVAKNKLTFQWKLGGRIVTGVGLVSVCLFIGLKYVKRSSL